MITKHNIRINLSILFPLLLIIVLSPVGCSSMKTTTNYDKNIDFKSFKTYTITPSIKNLRMNSDNKVILEDAITYEMNTKGYQKSNAINTDLLIDLFIKYDKSTEATQSSLMPVGIYTYAYSFGLGTTSINYHDSKDGTLFINIIDAKKKEIIWTGNITTGIGENQTDIEIEKLINKAIKKLFIKYPVSIQTEK
jgi:hypothetical protein